MPALLQKSDNISANFYTTQETKNPRWNKNLTFSKVMMRKTLSIFNKGQRCSCIMIDTENLYRTHQLVSPNKHSFVVFQNLLHSTIFEIEKETKKKCKIVYKYSDNYEIYSKISKSVSNVQKSKSISLILHSFSKMFVLYYYHCIIV